MCKYVLLYIETIVFAIHKNDKLNLLLIYVYLFIFFAVDTFIFCLFCLFSLSCFKELITVHHWYLNKVFQFWCKQKHGSLTYQLWVVPVWGLSTLDLLIAVGLLIGRWVIGSCGWHCSFKTSFFGSYHIGEITSQIPVKDQTTHLLNDLTSSNNKQCIFSFAQKPPNSNTNKTKI